MELYKFGWKPTEETFRWMEENHLTTREKLMKHVQDQREKAQELSRTDKTHSAAYYGVLDNLFARLIAGIDDMILFERLEPCWTYTFVVSSQGAEVCVQHLAYLAENGSCVYNAVYTLLTIPCHMLTVEEFAKIYGVEQVTVRQWIRRGKIRTAKKTGCGWLISELTELPGRGYTPGSYSWSEPLTDLPEEYAFLRDPASLLITQNVDDARRFVLTIFRMSATPRVETREGLTVQEREKLELLLLSHPLVSSSSVGETHWP